MSILRRTWSPLTSADPGEWTRDRPSHGQCAVTALLIQELLGGELLRTINGNVSHYWNRLPDGSELDLTRDQFDKWEPGATLVRDRDYVLSFPDTAYRYGVLRQRFLRAWSQETATTEAVPDAD